MNAETMRRIAENCLAVAEKTGSEPERQRYMRMAVAWLDLAEAQDWLDGKKAAASLRPPTAA